MDNIIQDYAWGSREYLQQLTGRPSTGPLAELWMGVHPRGGSRIAEAGKEISLARWIEEDPAGRIGSALAERFGNLPFLFKLLAAGEPLSIQAHPSKSQAEEGFRREEEAGIPRDAFHRNYKDDNHKPEIICALTPYWAMKGFRSPREIRENFLPWLPEETASRLFGEEGGDEAEDLRRFFRELMSLGEEEKAPLLERALAWCAGQESDSARWVGKMQEKYPGDIGVLSPLYLYVTQLQPGEALYLPAGELHAYLEGFGVELMANSDNVLRGGLTPKHMDVPELMKTLTFRCEAPQVLRPRSLPDGTALYDTPSEEFQLLSLPLAEEASLRLDAGYPPAILVVLEGELRIDEEGESLRLKAGESCFLSACRAARTVKALRGEARGFIARAVPE